MTELKYAQYISHPPRRQIAHGGTNVFDGIWVSHMDVGYDFTMGHQIITKPFISNNPCHTHDFQEFLAWFGTNPDDPDDFGGEVVLYMGEELERYVFHQPTIVSLPPSLPHCPLEVTTVDRPIVQLEIMLKGETGTRDPIDLGEKANSGLVAQNYPVHID